MLRAFALFCLSTCLSFAWAQQAAKYDPVALQAKVDKYLADEKNKSKPEVEAINRLVDSGNVKVNKDANKPASIVITPKRKLNEDEITSLKKNVSSILLESIAGNFDGGFFLSPEVRTQFQSGITVESVGPLDPPKPFDFSEFLARLSQYYNDPMKSADRSILDRLALLVPNARIDQPKSELVIPSSRQLDNTEINEAKDKISAIRDTIIGNYAGGLSGPPELRAYIKNLNIRIEFIRPTPPPPPERLVSQPAGYWQMISIPFWSFETHLRRGGHCKVMVPFDVAVVSYHYSWIWMSLGNIAPYNPATSPRMALAGSGSGSYPYVSDNFNAAMSALKRADSARSLFYLDKHLAANATDVLSWRLRAMALYDLSRDSEAVESARYSEALSRKTGSSLDDQAQALQSIQGNRRDFLSSVCRSMDDKAVELALANPPRLPRNAEFAMRKTD